MAITSKLLGAALLLSGVIATDAMLARKAHEHIVRQEAFFQEFLETYKNLKGTVDGDHCERRVIYRIYRYQICLVESERSSDASDDVLSFIYHQPRPALLRLLDTSDYYFRELVLGVSPKVVNSDFMVIWESSRWNK